MITKWILIVGDKPSPSMKPGAKPFEGAKCEQRLLEWIGYGLSSIGIYEVHYENFLGKGIIADNSCRLFEGGGDKWSIMFVIVNKDSILSKVNAMVKCDWIIALGNEASEFLGEVPHFKLPHPSGLNRQVNDKAYIEEQLKLCKEYL